MADEMYTIRQAALYMGMDTVDILLAIREGKLRAWGLPLQRGMLVRLNDLRAWRAEQKSAQTHSGEEK